MNSKAYSLNRVRILTAFTKKKKRKGRLHPKKEYIRCKLIRGHKRAQRQIARNIIPSRTLHKFDPFDQKPAKIWQELINVYKENPQFLWDISQTDKGPLTDGRSKRAEKSDAQKSFNDKFVFWYFSAAIVRKSFYYYVELLFSDPDPENLVQRFEISCCPGTHSEECFVKWREFKSYLMNEMLTEVGLEPWTPETAISVENSCTKQGLETAPEEEYKTPDKNLRVIKPKEVQRTNFENSDRAYLQSKFRFVPVCEPLWKLKSQTTSLAPNSAFTLFRSNTSS